jgi:hypothetical protein
MTEEEWLTCDQPQAMLDSLPDGVSERKLRLFACACCRRVWRLLSDARSKGAVEIAERHADGQATLDELEKSAREAWDASLHTHEAALHSSRAAWCAAETSPHFCAREAAADAVAATVCDPDDPEAEEAAQAALLHDIFGNPFRAVALAPSWLAWNDRAVLKLAQAIYNDRRFGDLRILADALEDAGCDNAEILAHCRSGGEHVRGCWVVDLLLNKI